MEHNHEFEGGHEHRHDHDHGPEHSKYEEALAKYNIRLHDEDVKAKTALLIEKHVAENNTPDVKKFLFHCIDLTTLKCTDSDESVMKFTGKVNEFVDKYPDLDNVAAICVYPNMAEVVNDTLEADHVNIACVSGGFPSSQTFTEVKVAETAMALHTGADEIDIVIPVGKFLSGDYEGMCDEIEELKAVCGEHHLKQRLLLVEEERGAVGLAVAAQLRVAVEEERVGKMLVVPYFMWVLTAVRKASSVHSIKSRPPPPWAWISTPPGSTYIPFTSISCAPITARSQLVTSSIFPSLISTEPSLSHPCGVRMRALIS